MDVEEFCCFFCNVAGKSAAACFTDGVFSFNACFLHVERNGVKAVDGGRNSLAGSSDFGLVNRKGGAGVPIVELFGKCSCIFCTENKAEYAKSAAHCTAERAVYITFFTVSEHFCRDNSEGETNFVLEFGKKSVCYTVAAAVFIVTFVCKFFNSVKVEFAARIGICRNFLFCNSIFSGATGYAKNCSATEKNTGFFKEITTRFHHNKIPLFLSKLFCF